MPYCVMLKRGVSHPEVPLSESASRRKPLTTKVTKVHEGNPNFSLPREPQQREDVHPEHQHEMPIPRRDVDRNPPGFQSLAPERRGRSPQQREHPAAEVNGVRDGQKKRERTAWIRIDEESACVHFAPGQPLADEKSDA